MKSFVYITDKKVPPYRRIEALVELWKWLNENIPERWDNRGNIINFQYDEDATYFLLTYTDEIVEVREI